MKADGCQFSRCNISVMIYRLTTVLRRSYQRNASLIFTCNVSVMIYRLTTVLRRSYQRNASLMFTCNVSVMIYRLTTVLRRSYQRNASLMFTCNVSVMSYRLNCSKAFISEKRFTDVYCITTDGHGSYENTAI